MNVSRRCHRVTAVPLSFSCFTYHLDQIKISKKRCFKAFPVTKSSLHACSQFKNKPSSGTNHVARSASKLLREDNSTEYSASYGRDPPRSWPLPGPSGASLPQTRRNRDSNPNPNRVSCNTTKPEISAGQSKNKPPFWRMLNLFRV